MSNAENFIEYVKGLGKEYALNGEKGICSLLSKVAYITKQSTDDVLSGADFKKEEINIEKLEAIIAELRTVVFLNNFKFESIELIKAKKSTKSPDIECKLGNKKFCVEVTCLTAEYSRKKEGNKYPFDNEKFKREFIERINIKNKQFELREESGKMFCFVLNKQPDLACYSKDEYIEIIKKVYNETYLNEGYYIGFITGLNDEDFIYPDLFTSKTFYKIC